MKPASYRNIVCWEKGKRIRKRDLVVSERALTIFLNDKELITLLSTPGDDKALTVGYLFSEGFLSKLGDIKSLVADEKKGIIRTVLRRPVDFNQELFTRRVLGSGCAKGIVFYNARDHVFQRKIKSKTKVRMGNLLNLMKKMEARSRLFQTTGGLHCAALATTNKIVIFKEDIGRHNALDKVLGTALLKKIKTSPKILLSSGRISSEVVVKTVRYGIPLLVSRSAATNLAIQMAKRAGLTLVGFARGRKLNVYTHAERITP